MVEPLRDASPRDACKNCPVPSDVHVNVSGSSRGCFPRVGWALNLHGQVIWGLCLLPPPRPPWVQVECPQGCPNARQTKGLTGEIPAAMGRQSAASMLCWPALEAEMGVAWQDTIVLEAVDDGVPAQCGNSLGPGLAIHLLGDVCPEIAPQIHCLLWALCGAAGDPSDVEQVALPGIEHAACARWCSTRRCRGLRKAGGCSAQHWVGLAQWYSTKLSL